MNFTNTLTYALSKYLSSILKQLQHNLINLVNKYHKGFIWIQVEDLGIIHDAKSWYTSIPIDTCLDFRNGLLENDETLSGTCPLSISSIMISLKLF